MPTGHGARNLQPSEKELWVSLFSVFFTPFFSGGVKIMKTTPASGSRSSSVGMWLSVAFGVVLTAGATAVVTLSGIGGHGAPDTPVADFLILPTTAFMDWVDTLPDTRPRPDLDVALIIAFAINIGVWTLVFRFLIWPLISILRGKQT